MGQLRFPEDDGPRRRGRARRGLDVSLKAMAAGGLREPIDEAFVALARIAADELDRATGSGQASPHVRATLIGRCAAVYSVLLERGDLGDAERFDDLFAAVRDSEEPGD